ncbi:thioredoxin family protein [Flavobacterium sp. RHBU_3]|uniref:thioredoxin family protein n=1 Tax=Flavobacterium sp. RHBU_3 TaxID=3391184 RepID=UPI0039850FBC
MITTESLIQNSLTQAFDYAGYRKHAADLLAQGMSTGHTQSEALTHYSSLNDTRMKRLDKTLVVPEEITQKLQNLEKRYEFVVISEGWCGDAAQIVPVLNKMALATDKIDLKLVLRDDNPELMDAYLTNGARSIPKLIVVDAETKQPITSWGPRPQEGAAIIIENKEKYGVVTDEAKTELQLWYTKDKGLNTMNEVAALLK